MLLITSSTLVYAVNQSMLKLVYSSIMMENPSSLTLMDTPWSRWIEKQAKVHILESFKT